MAAVSTCQLTTGLSETAINSVLEVWKSALLLCNICVEAKRQEQPAEALQVKKSSIEQMKHLENEMAGLKKRVSDIKTFVTSTPSRNE